MEAYIEKVMAEYGSPGLAIGVAAPGQPDRFWTFGRRNRELGLAVTPRTVFGAASLTKSMTAVAIMQLQERGLLSVQDPLVRYVPEFRTPDGTVSGQIALHHLLTHTAGLPPLPTLGKVLAGDLRTVREMLEYLAGLDYELLGAPGTVFSYSNESTALLGAVVERVSGLAYRTYMAERLFAPAGMTASSFDPPTGPEVTELYDPGDGGLVPIGTWWHSGPLTPARALCTTVEDLLRYTQLFRTGGLVDGRRLLREESIRAMTHPWVRQPSGDHYGYCLMLTPDYHGGSLVEHVGSTRGISAYFSVVPERGLAAVVLSNAGRIPAGRIALRAVNQWLGLPPETDRLPAPSPYSSQEALAAYAGRYGGSDGWPVTVQLAEGGTHLAMEGGARLVPVGVDRFRYIERETEMSATFLRNGAGAITSLFFGMRLLRRLS